MPSTVALTVARYRPEQESEPTLQTYEIPFRKDWVILDALNYVKDALDGSLSFRWSCRMGVCGSCGMTVNGTPKLTCATFLSDYLPGPIRVEPLDYFPVVRDLVVDITDFMQKLKQVKPWIIRKEEKPPGEGEYLQTPDQLDTYRQFSMCINCMRCSSRGAGDERPAPLYPVPSPMVPPSRVGLVVASEEVLHRVCPARAHQRLRGLFRRGFSVAAPRPRPGSRGLWAVPRPAEDAALPRPRYGGLPLRPLPCHYLVQSDPQGHDLAGAGQARAQLGHRRLELRGLARALRGRGPRAVTRVGGGTDHAALVALVQRRGDGRRAPHARPSHSDRPRLSPGMARGTPLRVAPGPPDASADATLPFRPHRLAALPLGPSLPVHALRRAAAETSDRAHRRPLLWRRPPGNRHGRVPPVGHRVASATEPSRGHHRRPRFMTEVDRCRGIWSSRIRPP